MRHSRVVVIFILWSVFTFSSVLQAEEVRNEEILSIAKKALSDKVEVVRVEPPEASPVSGWKQIRLWCRIPTGDIPILFYMSDDGRFYFAGTIYTPGGENLTRKMVGEMIPRKISLEDMKLNDAYRVGRTDAPVKIVFWMDSKDVSFSLWKQLSEIYTKNAEKVAIYIKFLPADSQDFNRLFAFTCFKGESIEEGFRVLSDVSPLWGERRDDIEAFLDARGIEIERCKEEDVKADMELARNLKLPKGPLLFVNGTILLTTPIKDGIARLSNMQLE